MAKTVIDFDDYNPPTYDEYDGDDPRPGWYEFELQKAGWFGDDGEVLRWIFVIAEGPYKGWAGFIFANFDSTKWKNQEVARAIQGGKETKLAVDFDNEKSVALMVKKAFRVRGKVENQTNRETGEVRLNLRKVRPITDGDGKKATSSASASADDVDEVDDAIVDYTSEELADMDFKDLKGILKDEFDFSAAELREIKNSKSAINAILDAQEEDAPDEETEEVEETEETEEGGDEEDFDDDFDSDGDPDAEDTEPEPEPEPAARRRRAAAPAKAAPAKAAPARKAAPAKAAEEVPAQRTRRARR